MIIIKCLCVIIGYLMVCVILMTTVILLMGRKKLMIGEKYFYVVWAFYVAFVLYLVVVFHLVVVMVENWSIWNSCRLLSSFSSLLSFSITCPPPLQRFLTSHDLISPHQTPSRLISPLHQFYLTLFLSHLTLAILHSTLPSPPSPPPILSVFKPMMHSMM